jgi:hypothetical protein
MKPSQRGAPLSPCVYFHQHYQYYSHSSWLGKMLILLECQYQSSWDLVRISCSMRNLNGLNHKYLPSVIPILQLFKLPRQLILLESIYQSLRNLVCTYISCHWVNLSDVYNKSLSSVVPTLQPITLLILPECQNQYSWNLVCMSCHLKSSQRCSS